MIIQLNPKGKKLKELDMCFQIFISFACSVDFKYINKRVIYSSTNQKLLPAQQFQNSKLVLSKTMTRKSF